MWIEAGWGLASQAHVMYRCRLCVLLPRRCAEDVSRLKNETMKVSAQLVGHPPRVLLSHLPARRGLCHSRKPALSTHAKQ
jgi:hypothetical protein